MNINKDNQKDNQKKQNPTYCHPVPIVGGSKKNYKDVYKDFLYSLLFSLYPDFSIEKNYTTQDDKIIVQKEFYIYICNIWPENWSYNDLGVYCFNLAKYMEEYDDKSGYEFIELSTHFYKSNEKIKKLRKFIQNNFPDYTLGLCFISDIIYLLNWVRFKDQKIYNIRLQNLKQEWLSLNKKSKCFNIKKYKKIWSRMEEVFIFLKFHRQDLEDDFDIQKIVDYESAENILIL